MALINCRECGKPVSTEASACPNCGAPPKPGAPPVAAKQAKRKSPVPGLIAVGILVGVIAMCSTDKKPAAPAEDTKPAKAECAKDDLQCNGDQAVVAAGVYCKDPVERMAKHSVRWTDGTFETKFSRFRWKDKAAGTLTMIGDKAEFQNGFGAYTPVIYECDLAADKKSVLDVRVREGRLPK